MSLSNTISVIQGATGTSLTAGSAVTFTNDGTGKDGKKVLIDASTADPRLRKKVITDVTIGATSVTSGSDKLHRQSVVVHQPFVNSKGVVYSLPANINIPYHPEMTGPQRETAFWNVIGVLVDAELANLRNLFND